MCTLKAASLWPRYSIMRQVLFSGLLLTGGGELYMLPFPPLPAENLNAPGPNKEGVPGVAAEVCKESGSDIADKPKADGGRDRLPAFGALAAWRGGGLATSGVVDAALCAARKAAAAAAAATPPFRAPYAAICLHSSKWCRWCIQQEPVTTTWIHRIS